MSDLLEQTINVVALVRGKISAEDDIGPDDAEALIRIIERLREQLVNATAVLEAYEQLEADMILENACWEGREVPQFTGDLWERTLEIQAMRNKALGRFAQIDDLRSEK